MVNNFGDLRVGSLDTAPSNSSFASFVPRPTISASGSGTGSCRQREEGAKERSARVRRQVSLPAAGEPGASLPRIRLQVRDAGAQSRRPKGPIGPLREPLRLSAAGPVITRMPCAETRSVASEGPSQRERARESERREGGGWGKRTRRQKACGLPSLRQLRLKASEALGLPPPPPGSSVQGSLLRNGSALRSAQGAEETAPPDRRAHPHPSRRKPRSAVARAASIRSSALEARASACAAGSGSASGAVSGRARGHPRATLALSPLRSDRTCEDLGLTETLARHEPQPQAWPEESSQRGSG